MKRLCAIFPLVLLAGCFSQPYNMKFGGDSVHYVNSRPVYSYFGSSYGFPYYGPYNWDWYYPVWYSPVPGPHYSWYCPGGIWSDPFYRPVGGLAYHGIPRQNKERPTPTPVTTDPDVRPIRPMDLRHAVVEPRRPAVYGKSMSYRAAGMKNPARYKTPMTGYKSPSVSSTGRYSGPRPSISRSPSPRSQSLGRVSKNLD